MMLTQSPRMKAIAEKKMNGEIVNPMAVIVNDQGKRLTPFRVQQRWDVVIRDWVISTAWKPSWWIMLPWKVGSFVRVALSRNVNDWRVAERNNACDACDQRYNFIRRNGSHTDHCAACKCPAWKLSTLEYKNRKAAWKCPLRKHEGPYPNDPQANSLMELGYEENAVLSAVGGGCTGCGCGKK